MLPSLDQGVSVHSRQHLIDQGAVCAVAEEAVSFDIVESVSLNISEELLSEHP